MASRPSVLELPDLHLDALYERDAAGLITASRDPSVTAPQFHLLRTPSVNRWLLRASLNSAQRERLASILSAQPHVPDCVAARAHPPDLDAIRAALAEEAPGTREYRGPAFFFPEELPPTDRAELLADRRRAPREGQFAWLRDATGVSDPIAVVRAADGEVVTVCYSARSTPAAAEAGVETVANHRGRGYGSMAVVAWAAALRRDGRAPLYSTEWSNAASLALARRIGLICYAEDCHMN
jgi:RimJ/RimL family protein N-acetyltransferase